MGSQPPVNAIGTGVRWPDMTADVSPVDLHRPPKNNTLRLARKGFPDLVRENKRCLVGEPRASGQLQRRHSLGAIDENGDGAQQVHEGQFAGREDGAARDAELVMARFTLEAAPRRKLVRLARRTSRTDRGSLRFRPAKLAEPPISGVLAF